MQIYLIIYFTKYFIQLIDIIVTFASMTKQITENKRKRLERNERIKARYHSEMANGGMSSAVIGGLCKSYRMTPPTVYSILRLPKKESEEK